MTDVSNCGTLQNVPRKTKSLVKILFKSGNSYEGWYYDFKLQRGTVEEGNVNTILGLEWSEVGDAENLFTDLSQIEFVQVKQTIIL